MSDHTDTTLTDTEPLRRCACGCDCNAVAARVAAARAEFEAIHLGVLAQARREAWDEGHHACYLFERGCTYPEPRNPYNEGADQ